MHGVRLRRQEQCSWRPKAAACRCGGGSGSMRLWGPLTRAAASPSKFTHSAGLYRPTHAIPRRTKTDPKLGGAPRLDLSSRAFAGRCTQVGSACTAAQAAQPGALAHSQTAPPSSPGVLARGRGAMLMQIKQPNLAAPVLPLRRRRRRPPACLRSVACCLHSLLTPMLACCRPAAATTERQHREAAERAEAGWIPTLRPCRTCRRRSSSS